MPNIPDQLTKLYSPCYYCKHLRNIGTQTSLKGWTCTAFPVEIPYDILSRATVHDERDMTQVGVDVYESKVYEFEDGKYTIAFDGTWTKVGDK